MRYVFLRDITAPGHHHLRQGIKLELPTLTPERRLAPNRESCRRQRVNTGRSRPPFPTYNHSGRVSTPPLSLQPTFMPSDATDYSVILFQDVYFLGILGILSLFAVPRYAARFSNAPEWGYGLMLYKRRRLPVYGAAQSRRSSNSNATAIAEPSSRTPEKSAGSRFAIIRIPAYSTLVPHLASILRWPWSDHLSIANIILLLLYIGGTVFACLWKTSPFNHTIRLGYVAVAQLPFVYALATKNNVIGWLLGGLGYEKVRDVFTMMLNKSDLSSSSTGPIVSSLAGSSLWPISTCSAGFTCGASHIRPAK